ncbi:MAG: hypothetical protein HZA90_15000 [Verrucomicrobia bacterium]|nr:hypothetical protein [Verrucomicrobiota bacterium]
MKVLTYDQLARDFPEAWAAIESSGEEVVVTRHRHSVARIVPEPPPATALEVFGDLHGVLGEQGGTVLATSLAKVRNGGKRQGTLQELRNPWAS